MDEVSRTTVFEPTRKERGSKTTPERSIWPARQQPTSSLVGSAASRYRRQFYSATMSTATLQCELKRFLTKTTFNQI